MIEVSFSITGPRQGNMVVTAEKNPFRSCTVCANFHKLHLLKTKKQKKNNNKLKYLRLNMLQMH